MADLAKFEHVKHEILRRLLAYWLDLRGDELVPRRAQLDPMAIPWALGHTWLMQLDLTVDRFAIDWQASPFKACMTIICRVKPFLI